MGCKIKDIWGGKGYGYFQLPRVGNSRGIVLIWDSRIFISKEAIGDKRFIVVKGDLKGKDDEVFLVCIYGSHVNIKEMIELNDFANDMRLVEIMMWGRKFTRVSDDGVKFSKKAIRPLSDCAERCGLRFWSKTILCVQCMVGTRFLSSGRGGKEEIGEEFSTELYFPGIEKISMKDAGWLETPFNEKKALDAIQWCGRDKSQVANGFNFNFIQKKSCILVIKPRSLGDLVGVLVYYQEKVLGGPSDLSGLRSKSNHGFLGVDFEGRISLEYLE
ncbi:hypothetical protein Tco_0686284 [Tanacetum coccineum]